MKSCLLLCACVCMSDKPPQLFWLTKLFVKLIRLTQISPTVIQTNLWAFTWWKWKVLLDVSFANSTLLVMFTQTQIHVTHLNELSTSRAAFTTRANIIIWTPQQVWGISVKNWCRPLQTPQMGKLHYLSLIYLLLQWLPALWPLVSVLLFTYIFRLPVVTLLKMHKMLQNGLELWVTEKQMSCKWGVAQYTVSQTLTYNVLYLLYCIGVMMINPNCTYTDKDPVTLQWGKWVFKPGG